MELNKTILLETILILSSTWFLRGNTGAAPDEEFSYTNGRANGPQKWGEIKPEWKTCSTGKAQSPIDILSKNAKANPELGVLRRVYKQLPATLVNRGHDIIVKWANGGGQISINGTKYTLKQIHFHSPSEHSFDGTRHPLEGHMVHETSDGKIAVIGILYKIGRPNPFLSVIQDHLPAIASKENAEAEIPVVNPKDMRVMNRHYYRYMGSLTTPPCSEDVTWTVIQKVRTVSEEQVKSLKSAVLKGNDMNSRPIQPINSRVVTFSGKKF